MSIPWALGVALLIGPAWQERAVSPSTASSEVRWHSIEREGAAPLRFATSALGGEESKGSLVFALSAAQDERAVEDVLAQVAKALPRGSSCTLASSLAARESFALVVGRCARTLGTPERAHVVGVGDGAREALALAIESTSSVASVIALAPSALAPEDLERASALAGTPVALVRGSSDAREPLLAVLEPLIDAGGDCAWLDFASTREHVAFDACENRFAERWTQFAALERERAAVESRVRDVLEGFHLAASRADLSGYLGALAPDAVFVGTDAKERWSVREFRAFCEPYFARGQGWTYRATERHVELSRDRRAAWFDERLANEKYGEVRGSGVLRLDGSRWRIAQYVMSFPVPNELAGDLVQRVKSLGK